MSPENSLSSKAPACVTENTRQAPIRALLFDVDGTLYSPTRVRLYMLYRLGCHTAANPARGLRDLRLLRTYRQAQEEMRTLGDCSPDQQLLISCSKTGYDPAAARLCIDRWMNEEPLQVLRDAIRPGVRSVLQHAKTMGMKLGVVSDYPAVDKLRAMGLLEFFEAIVSAQHAEVASFKPSPKGLLLAARMLNVQPEETLYIGDRPEVDAEAARRAGMRPVILGRPLAHPGSCRTVSNFHALTALFAGGEE
jgi:HAD superfamily hydrolase (TIGR01509 family)